MAGHNLSVSGSTSVLEASVSISEVTNTGTTRTLHVQVFVKPIDYGGARSFGYNVSCNGLSSSGNNKSLDGSGMVIFSDSITVNVPYGQTTASIDCTFNATVVSPSAGNKSISGRITKVTGLTLRQGDTALSGAADVYFGSACNVTWTPAASYLYFKLRFSLGTWSYTTGLFRPGTASSYTYTGYTIPYDAAKQIPNAVSAVMTVTLYTYENSSGSVQVGSASSTSFTVTLPASIKPSLGTPAVSIDNSSNAAVNTWGIAVAGFSKLKIVASASGIHGSTISRFKIAGAYDDIVTGSSLNYTGNVIQSSGSKSVTITCIDSRGRESNPITPSAISFVSYAAPTIAQFTAERNASGYACLKAIFSYDSVGGKNSATATLWYRRSGSTAAWVEYGTMQSNVVLTTNIPLNDEASYNFKLILKDRPGSSTEKIAFLSTAKVLLDFKKDGDGLGIGKICESPGMEVSMDATFFAGVNIGELTLEQFVQAIMRILPSGMYGPGDPPATGAKIGQIYFKKL